MYAIETTKDETNRESLIFMSNDPTRWHQHSREDSHKDACATALKLRDAGRDTGERPVVRVRGLAGDDKGKTTLIMQRIAWRH